MFSSSASSTPSAESSSTPSTLAGHAPSQPQNGLAQMLSFSAPPPLSFSAAPANPLESAFSVSAVAAARSPGAPAATPLLLEGEPDGEDRFRLYSYVETKMNDKKRKSGGEGGFTDVFSRKRRPLKFPYCERCCPPVCLLIIVCASLLVGLLAMFAPIITLSFNDLLPTWISAVFFVCIFVAVFVVFVAGRSLAKGFQEDEIEIESSPDGKKQLRIQNRHKHHHLLFCREDQPPTGSSTRLLRQRRRRLRELKEREERGEEIGDEEREAANRLVGDDEEKEPERDPSLYGRVLKVPLHRLTHVFVMGLTDEAYAEYVDGLASSSSSTSSTGTVAAAGGGAAAATASSAAVRRRLRQQRSNSSAVDAGSDSDVDITIQIGWRCRKKGEPAADSEELSTDGDDEQAAESGEFIAGRGGGATAETRRAAEDNAAATTQTTNNTDGGSNSGDLVVSLLGGAGGGASSSSASDKCADKSKTAAKKLAERRRARLLQIEEEEGVGQGDTVTLESFPRGTAVERVMQRKALWEEYFEQRHGIAPLKRDWAPQSYLLPRLKKLRDEEDDDEEKGKNDDEDEERDEDEYDENVEIIDQHFSVGTSGQNAVADAPGSVMQFLVFVVIAMGLGFSIYVRALPRGDSSSVWRNCALPEYANKSRCNFTNVPNVTNSSSGNSNNFTNNTTMIINSTSNSSGNATGYWGSDWSSRPDHLFTLMNIYVIGLGSIAGVVLVVGFVSILSNGTRERVVMIKIFKQQRRVVYKRYRKNWSQCLVRVGYALTKSQEESLQLDEEKEFRFDDIVGLRVTPLCYCANVGCGCAASGCCRCLARCPSAPKRESVFVSLLIRRQYDENSSTRNSAVVTIDDGQDDGGCGNAASRCPVVLSAAAASRRGFQSADPHHHHHLQQQQQPDRRVHFDPQDVDVLPLEKSVVILHNAARGGGGGGDDDTLSFTTLRSWRSFFNRMCGADVDGKLMFPEALPVDRKMASLMADK